MNNKASYYKLIEFRFPKALVDNTLIDLQNSLDPSQPHLIIANYFLLGERRLYLKVTTLPTFLI